jgi:excisionase family DNA binding protein
MTERLPEPISITLSPEAIELIAHRAAELVLQEIGTTNGSGSPWLSLRDAAEYVRLSERTLEREIARGRLRSSTVGRRRLLHRDELDRFARAAGEE